VAVLSVGIDVAENRGLDVVVVDAGRHLVGAHLPRVSPDELRTRLEALKPDLAVVAIDSPPGIGSSGRSRPCELSLRARGLNIFSTPSDPARFARPFYNWMRVGQEAFQAAHAAGFELFAPGRGVRGSAVEVYPHASDVALRGRRPPPGVTRSVSRKRSWRSDTLRLAGLEGTDRLRSIDAVDAALAALTGLFAVEGSFEAVGVDPFFIIVPAPAEPVLRPAAGWRNET
jgi:predicted nuclease with RNAse H fold